MSAHAAISAKMLAFPGLTALVGQRIYADVMPDSPTYPSVTYQKTGGSSDMGALTNPTGAKALMQVSVWSKSRAEATAVVKQVKLAIERMRKITIGGVPVDDCYCDGDVDNFDAPTKTYFTHISFRLHFKEV